MHRRWALQDHEF